MKILSNLWSKFDSDLKSIIIGGGVMVGIFTIIVFILITAILFLSFYTTVLIRFLFGV